MLRLLGIVSAMTIQINNWSGNLQSRLSYIQKIAIPHSPNYTFDTNICQRWWTERQAKVRQIENEENNV